MHRQIEKAKTDYFTGLLHDCKGDFSKLWKAFKQVLPSKLDATTSNLKVERGPCITAKSIGDGFNQFFVSIGNKLGRCFTCDPRALVYDTVTCQSTFTLAPVTTEFVSKFIIKLKANKATGLDKISARLLKEAA